LNEEEKEKSEERDSQSEILNSEQTVGEIFLEARKKAGLSLEDVSEETKIPRAMLEHIETDNFDAMPAKVYARGFIKSYAQMLGLDTEYILNKYEVQTGQTHTSKGDRWELETEVVEEIVAPPRILKKLVICAVIIIVAIVLIRLVFHKREKVKPPQIPDLKEEVLGREGQQGERVVAEKNAGRMNAGSPVHEDETKPGAAKETAPVNKPATQPAMKLIITANPSDSTWFEIAAISTKAGIPETLGYSFLLLPGERKSFEATDKFLLKKIGNAGGFRMELDGMELPSLGKRGAVRSNIIVDRNGLSRAR